MGCCVGSAGRRYAASVRLPNHPKRYAVNRLCCGRIGPPQPNRCRACYVRESGKYFTTPSCTTVATGRPERSKK